MTSVVANRKSGNRLLPSESDSGQKVRSMFNGAEEGNAKYAFARTVVNRLNSRLG